MFQVGKESKSKHSSQMCILILFLISQLEQLLFKPTTTGFFKEGIFILTQLHCLFSDLLYSASKATVMSANKNIRINCTPVKLTLYSAAGKSSHCPEPVKCTQF